MLWWRIRLVERNNHWWVQWCVTHVIGIENSGVFKMSVIHVVLNGYFPCHQLLLSAVTLNEHVSPPLFSSLFLPLSSADAFTSRVLRVLLRDVKLGETVSYKRLAEMAGNPRAVRAVGGAMRRNPVSVADVDWQASLQLTSSGLIGEVISSYVLFYVSDGMNFVCRHKLKLPQSQISPFWTEENLTSRTGDSVTCLTVFNVEL